MKTLSLTKYTGLRVRTQKRKNNILKMLLAAAMCLIIALPCSAAKPEEQDIDPMDLDIEQNLSTPQVPSRSREKVKKSVADLLRQFRKLGFNSGLVRDEEVLMLSIPCDKLFHTGTAELSASGKKTVTYLKGVAAAPKLYKIIIAVHTDDTGDDTYSYKLSEDRANAIDDYLIELTGDDINSVPYGIGFDQPLKDNSSRKSRAENRRTEIYLVPLKNLF